jgi:hypothetical protein
VDQLKNTSKYPLHVPNGSMTRSKTKALNALVLKVSTKSELIGPLEYQEEALVHLIHCKRGSIQPYLGHEVRTTKETKESYYKLEKNMGGYLFLLFLGIMSCMKGYK